ncbi:hypothetical protein Cch01nite_19530 [Cellulomonas chitinilytica]|uniref:DUF805 domain-containing protein n=1 Tax=Cellulomonas chitinilytica TaxID=398759 RepID=A0A919P4I3_9CELL|nr:hypothetical protein [Cellulomonas chitinilytica]GIG21229.1 hypothetical protein Cch01nite_19530 [Cellulomonas chitinilytica]
MDDPYASTSSAMPAAVMVIFFVFYAAAIAFGIYCYVRVARKAGYSGWYAALCFVPIANIVVLLMFCFKEWPIERELRELRAAVGGYPAAGYPVAASYGYRAAPTPPWEQPQPGTTGDPRFAPAPSPYGQGPDGTTSPYGQQH